MKKKSKASDRPRKSSPRSIDAARRIEQVFNRLKTEREAAVEARALAEAGERGALHRESQAERESRLVTLQLDGILQSAMDAIITVDDWQNVVLFNEAAAKMFGYPAGEAIGHPISRFIPERFREAHAVHVRAFGQSGATNRKMGRLGTITGLRATGEEFPAEASISQIAVEGKKYFKIGRAHV